MTSASTPTSSFREFLAHLMATPRKHHEDDDDSVTSSSSSSSGEMNSVGIASWLLVAWITFVGLYIVWHSVCQARQRRNSNNDQADDDDGKEDSPPDFGHALQDTTLKVRRCDILLPGQTLDGRQQDEANVEDYANSSSNTGTPKTRRAALFRPSYEAVEQDADLDNGHDDKNNDRSLDALERADSSFESFDDEEGEDILDNSSELLAGRDDDDDDLEETNTKRLCLPVSSNTTTTRTVPCLCAICLSSFRPRQLVSWASDDTNDETTTTTTGCVHAFHTSCMVHYCNVAWKNHETVRESRQVACPLCREPFVTLTPKTAVSSANLEQAPVENDAAAQLEPGQRSGPSEAGDTSSGIPPATEAEGDELC